MGVHVEWFRNPTLTVAAPGDVEDGHGSVNDEAALVISNDEVAVIEITEDNYARFAKRLREIADAFDAAAPKDGLTIIAEQMSKR